jgi:hypothetical protein
MHVLRSQIGSVPSPYHEYVRVSRSCITLGHILCIVFPHHIGTYIVYCIPTSHWDIYQEMLTSMKLEAFLVHFEAYKTGVAHKTLRLLDLCIGITERMASGINAHIQAPYHAFAPCIHQTICIYKNL